MACAFDQPLLLLLAQDVPHHAQLLFHGIQRLANGGGRDAGVLFQRGNVDDGIAEQGFEDLGCRSGEAAQGDLGVG